MAFLYQIKPFLQIENLSEKKDQNLLNSLKFVWNNLKRKYENGLSPKEWIRKMLETEDLSEENKIKVKKLFESKKANEK